MPWLIVALAALLAILLGRGVAARMHATRPALVIADGDAALVRARERALDARAELLRHVRERPDDVYVRLPDGHTPGGGWFRLAALEEDRLRAVAVDDDAPAVEREAAFDEMLDWQVELEDGRIAGGWSVLAFFDRAESTWGRLPAGLREQRRRYLES